MNTTSGVERAVFFLLAVVVIGLLTFRPIPSVTDVNDTGRYLSDFDVSCSAPALNGWREHPSFVSFDIIFRPLCWVGSEPRLFMFAAGFAIPLALIMFGTWGSGKILWALGALLSVYGFEFATNALRQGLGIVFLLGAIAAILRGRRFIAVVALLIAVIIHVSNAAFVPLVLLIWMKSSTNKLGAGKSAFLIVASVIVIAGIVYAVRPDSLGDGSQLYDIFAQIYSRDLSPLFVIFVSLPVFYTYAVRKIASPRQVWSIETITVSYAAALLLLCLILFPYIAYRFAFTCCVLQAYISMRARSANVRQAFYVSLGLALMLGIFIGFSHYEQSVLFG